MQIEDKSLRFAGGPRGFLLIHGLGGTPVELRFVAQGLTRAGYTVHVPQLAGHCESAEELQATTWQQWYESVEEEHHRLREHCSTIVVGGLSMGAILASPRRPASRPHLGPRSLCSFTLARRLGHPLVQPLLQADHTEMARPDVSICRKAPLGHQGPAHSCDRRAGDQERRQLPGWVA